MDLSADERDLLLSALCEYMNTRTGDDQREQVEALLVKLGGDPEAMPFGARNGRDADLEALRHLPGLDDEPDGVYYPRAVSEDDAGLAERQLARLLAECVANGRHHLATLDHPEAGMILGCTHCHRYWCTLEDSR